MCRYVRLWNAHRCFAASQGPIAFGGGGIIISRALLEKMQARVDECAVRFRDVIGGDGMIVRCPSG